MAESKDRDFKFDKMAASYDAGFKGKVLDKFYALLVEQVDVRPGMTVLDVGCGTGTLLRRLSDKAPMHGYGIDIEKEMIAEAQKKCPDMVIQLSSCENTPFSDDQFDVITACLAYHHFADKQGFAKEAARILKRGGSLYIAEPRFPRLVRKAINSLIKQLHIVGYLGSPQEIYDTFRGEGFVMVGVYRDGYAQVVKLRLT